MVSLMSLTFEVADSIFKAEKTLLKPMNWRSAPSSRNEIVRSLVARLLIGQAVPRGVFFRIMLQTGFPDQCTFQLECERPNDRTRDVLYRLEVAPLRPHLNKPYGPYAGLLIPAGVTHEHIFYDSRTATGGMRARLDEQARIVSDPPQDFASALARVCSRINILNGTDVPGPDAQGLLL